MGATIGVPIVRETAKIVIRVAVDVGRRVVVQEAARTVVNFFTQSHHVDLTGEPEEQFSTNTGTIYDILRQTPEAKRIELAREIAEEAATLSELHASVISTFDTAMRSSKSENKSCAAPGTDDDLPLQEREIIIYDELLYNIAHFLTNIGILEEASKKKFQKLPVLKLRLDSFKRKMQMLRDWITLQQRQCVHLEHVEEQDVYHECEEVAIDLTYFITEMANFERLAAAITKSETKDFTDLQFNSFEASLRKVLQAMDSIAGFWMEKDIHCPWFS